MTPRGVILLAAGTLAAQVPSPTQQGNLTQAGQSAPVFHSDTVTRTTTAIAYHTGTTETGFRGTRLLPESKGKAKVNSRTGATKIDAKFDNLTPAISFGSEYLTYVMWAITPEGRAQNLGELVLHGDDAKLQATTPLQTFGLIVTAEPYFAVARPSDLVVMESYLPSGETTANRQVSARYEALQRGSYTTNLAGYQPVVISPRGPLQVAEARNAVEIARLAGAAQYAPDTLRQAEANLQIAEDYALSEKHQKESLTNARAAAQMAEDARIITYRRREEQALAEQHAAAVQAQKMAAEQATRAQQEAARAQQAQAEREAAERARAEAAAAAQKAATDQAQAERARAEAQAEAARAEQVAQQAQQARMQAENQQDQLRERLRQQLNAVLQTQETARGLIVNIRDVLFATNQYTLTSVAREKLAKVAGILLAYPDLNLHVEGYTDSTGSDAYNLKLSQDRADAVRSYLVQQGVAAANITATGMGKEDPVASNATAQGRQENRRVELVVSGASIGR